MDAPRKTGLDWQNVPLPLYQGLSEQNDKHGLLNRGAPVSKNVSFSKEGALATRRDFKSFATGIIGGNARVWNSSEETRVVTDSNVYSLDFTRGATLLGSVDAGLEQEEFGFNQGFRGTTGYTCVDNGDDLVVAWEVPSAVTESSLIYVAAMDKETGKFVWGPEIVTGSSQPKLAVSTGGITLCSEFFDTSTSTYKLAFTPVNFTAGAYSLGTQLEVVLHGKSTQVRQLSIAGSTSADEVWYIYSMEDPAGADWGETGIGIYNRAAGTATRATLSDGVSGTITGYSGNAFVCAGFHSVSEVPWFATCSEHDGIVRVFSASSGLVPTSQFTALDTSTSRYGIRGARATASAGPVIPPSTSAFTAGHKARDKTLMDGFFLPTPTGMLLAWHGAASLLYVGVVNGETANVEDIDYLGTEIVRFDNDEPATAADNQTVHGTLIASPGWLDSAGHMQTPAIWASAWIQEIPTADGPAQVFSQLPPASVLPFAITNSTFKRDVYATGIVMKTVVSTLATQAHTPFGKNELYPPTFPDGTRGIRMLVPGGGFAGYSVTPRRTTADIEPYIGSIGATSSRFARDSAGYSGTICKFTESPKSSNVSTPYRGVISSGGVRVFDGADIMDAILCVPPQPQLSAGFIEGTNGTAFDPSDSYSTNMQFCWAWVDEQGLRWRSPPSTPLNIFFNNWDVAADVFRFWFQVPPPISPFQAGRLYLEVYREQTDTEGLRTPQATMVLDHFFPVDPQAGIFSLEFEMSNTQFGAPILYTTGGVLPDEAPFPAKQLVYAANRVWYIFNNRLYYSKQAAFTKPLGFNDNLYLESPDGTRFTGVATMDEMVIVFTEGGIFRASGQGPNDTGGGPGLALQGIQTPTGCRSYKSVLSTEYGVFFMGERGIHLLGRNLQVTYIGRPIEDTFPEGDVDFALFNRDRKECMWYVDDTFYVFDTQAGAWFVLQRPTDAIVDGAWTVNEGVVFVTGGLALSEGDDTVDCLNLVHSTPWIDLSQEVQGYQRTSHILIQGHTDAIDGKGDLTVRIYFDHETTAARTQVVQLYNETTLDPFELKIPVGNRQKCRVFRVELDLSASDTDLTFTAINALVGYKPGGDKIRNT